MDKDTDRLLPPEPRERQTSSRSNQSVVSEDEFVYEGCNACNPVHWSHRSVVLTWNHFSFLSSAAPFGLTGI